MSMEQNLSGVIVINKPAGKTSHDMVGFLRRLLHIKRIGHTGTLDPDATGVLPLCIGICTKASQFIMDSAKRYTATMQLGAATTTQDASGEVTHTGVVEVGESEILDAIQSFVGEVEQIPPMYSAVKVNGKKLYELAREGKEVERKSRTIQVYAIENIEVNIEKATVRFEVECSKGTYIRTLIHDIGLRLGCYAHMTSLVRTKSGGFSLEDAYTCEQLALMCENGTIADAIHPTESVFRKYPAVSMHAKDTWRVRNGVPVTVPGVVNGEKYRVYGENGEFLCVSAANESGVLKMITSFWSE